MPTTVSSQVEAVTREGRSGIALCLSGGGFRASLFHLGALRRLHELGILQRVSAISAVSGGSIVAGQLAQSLHDSGRNGQLDFANWQREVADPFRQLAGRDLRTWPILKNFLWNWAKAEPLLKDLEERYSKRLTKLRLGELPTRPRFIFCATDLTFGVNWEFSCDRVGSYQAGYIYKEGETPGSNTIPVARAITASACFPPLFGPMPVRRQASDFVDGKYTEDDRDKLLSDLVLSDGGVYDNMALQSVWRTAATVLVSDCGAPFDYVEGKPPFRTLLRYTSVVSRQTQTLRTQMLHAAWNAPLGSRLYEGTRWHLASGKSEIPSATDLAGAIGYEEKFAKNKIARIRTDLDAFSEGEMNILENHGYCNADYRIRRFLPHLIMNDQPALPPYLEWMDEARAAPALANSGKRLVPKRLFTRLSLPQK